MNKNLIIILSIVGIIALAGIGYAIWNASDNPQVVNQENPGTTTNTANTNTIQAGAPIVQTDSTTAPYISTVVVNGTVNPKGSETTFWFEYGLTAELGAVTGFQLAGSGNALLPISALISNLQPFTKYYFRLNANNQFGTTNGEIMNFTTKKK